MMALQCKRVNPGAGSARRLIAARLREAGIVPPRPTPVSTSSGYADRGLRGERLAERGQADQRRDHRLDQGAEPEPRGPEEAGR